MKLEKNLQTAGNSDIKLNINLITVFRCHIDLELLILSKQEKKSTAFTVSVVLVVMLR